MKKVYICSPYRGDVEKNVEVAKAMCRKAIREGLEPIAPHLYYTQFLNDDDPKQRALGLELGISCMKYCSEVWKLRGVETPGMTQELILAGQIGIPVMEVQDDCR